MWVGIKHAINSTLGTTEFKPLDQKIDAQTTIIEQFILRNKTFTPSGNTLMTWDNAFQRTSTTAGVWKTIGTFTPYISGFANLKVWVYTLNRDYARVAVHILEDGTYKYGAEWYGENDYDDSTVLGFNNCEFLAGKTYKFDFVALTNTNKTNAVTGFNYLKLNADLVDGFPYNYTIGG